jgi:hypothetical protein
VEDQRDKRLPVARSSPQKLQLWSRLLGQASTPKVFPLYSTLSAREPRRQTSIHPYLLPGPHEWAVSNSGLFLQDLMAALLLAEEFFSVEQLKPWWRLWAFPLPDFNLDSMLPHCATYMHATVNPKPPRVGIHSAIPEGCRITRDDPALPPATLPDVKWTAMN